ncbi:MAG: hypothetical protein AAF488_16215 [Planctomycetota bacterium]
MIDLRSSASRLAQVVVAIVVSLLWVGSASAGELKRIRYRWIDREVEAVAEVTLPADTGPIKIHLFSEELSQHYTVSIPVEDMISLDRVAPEEQKKIADARAAKISQATAARKEAKERRRAERERKKAIAKAKEARKEDRSGRRTRGRKSDGSKSEGRRVRTNLPSGAESLVVMDEEIEPIRDRVQYLVLKQRMTDSVVKSISDEKKLRPVREVRFEAAELAEQIESIQTGFERVVKSRDRFERDVRSGVLSRPRDADERSSPIFRLLAKYNQRSLEAAARMTALEEELERVSSVVGEARYERALAEKLLAKAVDRMEEGMDFESAFEETAVELNLPQAPAKRAEGVASSPISAPEPRAEMREVPREPNAAPDRTTVTRAEDQREGDDEDEAAVAPASNSNLIVWALGLVATVVGVFWFAVRGSDRSALDSATA